MQSKSTTFQNALTSFLTEDVREEIRTHTEQDVVESKLIDLFRRTVDFVPAYKQFLKEHHINPDHIDSLENFKQLPLANKTNYIKKYPLHEICRGGSLDSCDFYAFSSGSTGEPTIWPRSPTNELLIARRFEQMLIDSFQGDTRSTLAVICFPMGTWVGGLFTTNCLRYLSMKGYRLTLITPGNNKAEILRVAKSEITKLYDQTIFYGYPPFIKDVIDSGIAEGINWKTLNLKMVFAGEVFSEEWRKVVAERAGFSNLFYSSVSMYGTADAGVLANETPLSIVIREYFSKHPGQVKELFGESRLPTLLQYDPVSRYFEVDENKTLLFSGDNGVPLIRYHIADNGGVLTYNQMIDYLSSKGFDPIQSLKDVTQDREVRGIYKMPFVFVFGRAHFAISYFGANIYVENVTVGLEQEQIKEWVTGKFVMEVKDDSENNKFFQITVELAPNIQSTIDKQETIAKSVLEHIRRLNSEFTNYVPIEKQKPSIVLLPLGDPDYFPTGVKHRYKR